MRFRVPNRAGITLPSVTRRFGVVAAYLGLLSLPSFGQVQTPALMPASSIVLPTTVTATCVTAGATLYYTTDGSVPDTNATVYSTPLTVTDTMALRVRAYVDPGQWSDTAYGYYYNAGVPPSFSYIRSATNSTAFTADFSIPITHDTNAVCHTVEECWTGSLTPTNITGDGVWLPELQAIRWGPFVNVPTQQLAYSLVGAAGTYSVTGYAVVDGQWTFGPAATSFTLGPTNGSAPIPTPLPQAAAPVFMPPSGSNVPLTNVTIMTTTAGAQIYFTLDGTVPQQTSLLYTGALSLVSETLIRAVAFATNDLPSDCSVAYYPSPSTVPVAQVQWTVDTSVPAQPVVSVVATQTISGSCLAYEEFLAPGLAAANISGDGVFDPTNNEIKWGPYLGSNVLVFSYAVTGLVGSYPASGRWSIDGGGQTVAGVMIVIASSATNAPTLSPPVQAPMPVLSPSMGTSLPVSVTITTALAGATIRYTTDGSAPSDSSPVYSTPLLITTMTTVRARTYAAGYAASDASYGYYWQRAADHTLSLIQTVVNDGSYLPSVQIAATPSANASCYAVVETLGEELTPYNISQAGVWNPTNNTIKWGPFLDATARTLAFDASGPSATYALTGYGSVDGVGVAATGQCAVTVNLATMAQVALPVLSPTPTGQFPINVTIACVTTNAAIYYTTDGSVPDSSSTLYTGPIRLDTTASIRARGYAPWMLPSSVADVTYGNEMPSPSSSVVRTIFNNMTAHPSVQLAVTAGADVRCYALVEQLQAGVTPSAITGDGHYNVGSQTIKWGPFMDCSNRVFTYLVSGPDGAIQIGGAGSFNGFPVRTTGDSDLAIYNDVGFAVSLTNNWTLSPSITVRLTPEPQVHCYLFEVMLPPGITATNISLDGLANTNTQAIKWGPYLDNAPRSFTYTLKGPQGTVPVQFVISFDGVSQTISGNQSVAMGLPPPSNLTVTAGNTALYLNWTATGFEAGFNVYYWTLTNRLDMAMIDAGDAPGAFPLTNLINGTNYYVMVRAYDEYGMESADSATVMGVPNAAGGAWGVIAFDRTFYSNITETASVTLWDPDLNTDPTSVQTVLVWVTSDSDANGIAVLLTETSANSPWFTTLSPLVFSFTNSNQATCTILVREGDHIYVQYNDALPAGIRTATAQFMLYDGNGNGVPDWWERVYFGSYNVVTTDSDSDGDGMSDYDEWRTGTNPRDPTDYLHMTQVVRSFGGVDVSWSSKAGIVYDLYKSYELTNGYFILLENIPGMPPTNTYYDIDEGKPVFYHVGVK